MEWSAHPPLEGGGGVSNVMTIKPKIMNKTNASFFLCA